MKHKLVITKENEQIISTLFHEKDLIQINVETLNSYNILGNIYLGKVKNIIKNINAAFVELSDGVMSYLSLGENIDPIFANAKKNNKIQIGDEIMVQVAKENIKTKAPVITTNLNLTGKYVVLTRGKTRLSLSGKIKDEEERRRLKTILADYENEEFGFIIRTNAQFAEEDKVRGEIRFLSALYDNIKIFGIHKERFSLLYQAPPGYICDIRDGFSEHLDEITTDDSLLYEEIQSYLNCYQKEDLEKLRFYEDKLISLNLLYGIPSKIEKALQKKVWLKCGATLIIEPTEALTVIDVNTGKAIDGRKKVQETFFKVNMEAAEEIAKQLRLRNLSGIIIIDFIDMDQKESRDILLKKLQELFQKDPIKTVVVDITELGLVEVTRKKVRKPLHEQYKGV
jgi:Ribonucleases G and E